MEVYLSRMGTQIVLGVFTLYSHLFQTAMVQGANEFQMHFDM